MHYASRSFTISVLRLDDRQDWRDTPHIVIYVVLYTEIHIIYFKTRTLAYCSMSGALILLTYETENQNHIFFYAVMVAITLALHTVWGDWVSATLGCCWLHLVLDPTRNISVVLVLYSATLHGLATTGRGEQPTVTQRHQDIYLPRLYIATIKSPLGLAIHFKGIVARSGPFLYFIVIHDVGNILFIASITTAIGLLFNLI